MADPLTLVAEDLLLKIRAENERHREEILRLEQEVGLATKGVAVGATLQYGNSGTLLIQKIDLEKRCVAGLYTSPLEVPFVDIVTLWSNTNG